MLDVFARSLMRAWYRSRESALATVPYPEDAPVARVPGPGQLRTLLLGNGAASGWGVRSHDLALTGHLARELARSTARGVQVDARVDRTLRLDRLGRLLDGVDLERYDAVVLIAGMSDAVNLTPLARWRRSMQHLVRRIRDEAPGAVVLVLGPQPVQSVSTYTGWPGAIAERHRDSMNRISEDVCAGIGAMFDVMPAPRMAPGVPGHRSPHVYADWATSITESLAPHLTRTVGRAAASQPERDRQRAAAAMLPDAPPDAGLDRITRLARDLFDADFAAVSLLDGDEQKNRSIVGADLGVLPRAASICEQTIKADAPLVIGDLAGDARFERNAAVHGELHLRFYAGYPIESPDGYRIGALCVLGRNPRDPRDVDTDALADLALLAQKELWASVDRMVPGPR